MHAQEVAQEVLAPQERARSKLRVFCGLPARTCETQEVEIPSARSYEPKPQEPARSYLRLRLLRLLRLCR